MTETEAQWLAQHPDRRINVYGQCDLYEPHEPHVDDGWSCPGQRVQCRNCDDRKCMGCVFREWDHECAEDCPMCCVSSLPQEGQPEKGGEE